MTSKIEINVDPAGIGSIVIDGKDISHMTTGMNIRIRAGKLTHVHLLMAADIATEMDGIVTSASTDGRTRHVKVTPEQLDEQAYLYTKMVADLHSKAAKLRYSAKVAS